MVRFAVLYLVGCTPDQKREGHGPNGEETVTRGRGRGVISWEKGAVNYNCGAAGTM
jgi:hypothetical protein